MKTYLLGSMLGGCDDSTVALDSCHSGSVAGAMSGDMADGEIEDMVAVRMRVVPCTPLLLHPRIGTATFGVGGLQSLLPDNCPCIFCWNISV